MVEVLILETGEKLDVIGDVNYTKSVADIGDVSKVNTSYSWTLKFPKTPNNTRIFDFLGINGNSSSTPYRSIKVAILDNGYSVVRNGNLQITETNGAEYKGNVKDGIIDFFNAMGDLSLADLDLSEIDHDNTKQAIFDNWSNPNNFEYRYLLANYNGQFLADVGGVSNYSNTSLIPSAKVSYLMDKLFSKHGWSYSGLPDIENDFLSYPLSSDYEVGLGAMVSEVEPFDLYNREITWNQWNKKEITWTSIQSDPNYVNNVAPQNFVITDNGYIKVVFPNVTFSDQTDFWAIYVVKVNGEVRGVAEMLSPEPVDVGSVIAGDIITTEVWLRHKGVFKKRTTDVIFDGNIFLYRKDVAPISFSENFEIYKQKDFLKEIMMQYGVIAIADTNKKHIKFIDIEQRLHADVIDWSDYFVSKESETYYFGSYAQNNYFKMKYDADGMSYNDGVIEIDNENLKIENTIFESKAYSPERNGMIVTTTNAEISVPTLKVFNIELKNDDNVLTAEYKTIPDRFFFLTARAQNFGKVAVNGDIAPAPAQLAMPKVYKEIILNKYEILNSLINRMLLVKVKVALPAYEVLNLDFEKVYYFSQLGGFFLIDKLTYKNNEVTTVELIKIDKQWQSPKI